MAETIRYLLTVDAATGATLRIEKVGDAGELTEVSGAMAVPAAVPPTGSVVFNIYVGQGGATVQTHPILGSALCPAPGSATIPAPGSATIPAPGSATIPAPGKAACPAPGSATIPAPGRAPIPDTPDKK